jgi:hypothetical protein
VPSSAFLKEAGGFSIVEYAKSKEGWPCAWDEADGLWRFAHLVRLLQGQWYLL